MKRRKIAILFCVVLLLVGAFAAFEYSKSRGNVVKVLISTPQLQSVDIGDYPTLNDGQKLAIQELSRQLKIHPKTMNFKVMWATPPQKADKPTAAFFLSYALKTQILGWDFQYLSRPRLTWRYPFYRSAVIFGGRDGLYVDPKYTPQEIHRAAQSKSLLLGTMWNRNLYGAGYDYQNSK